VETQEIDRRLQRYTATEHRIGANLQELEQHSVYQLLTTDVLTGTTAKAFAAFTAADPNLWELFTLFSTTLDTARRLRGTGTRLRNEDRIELGLLLQSNMVLIRSENVPLADRGLTGASTRDEKVSIETLIQRMSGLYEPVRDAVTHAEEVLRDALPRLNSAETTTAKLREQARSLGIDTLDLDRIDRTIASIRDLSLTDPLSIPKDARESFDEAIRGAANRIALARSSHDKLASDMAAASAVLDECRDLIAQAGRYRSDSIAKISQPFGLRQPPNVAAIDGPGGLAERLQPILNSAQPWQAVRNQLDIWSQGANRFRDQLQRVVDANKRPLQKREELRGRLIAFRAKMAATGYSEDLVLRDISAEAHNELFTAPTDLSRAERLVTEFGNRLAAS